MAITGKLAQRQLSYVLGSNFLASKVAARADAGAGEINSVSATSAIVKQRLAKDMNRRAAGLFIANLVSDTDVIAFTETKLAYALGGGGYGQAVIIDGLLG
jgi:hypothetical protein